MPNSQPLPKIKNEKVPTTLSRFPRPNGKLTGELARYHFKVQKLDEQSKRKSAKSLKQMMPDAIVKHCYACGLPFTMIRRKHHCRLCGNIFCNADSSQTIDGSWAGYAGFVRVCDFCAETNDSERLIKIKQEEMLREKQRQQLLQHLSSPHAWSGVRTKRPSRVITSAPGSSQSKTQAQQFASSITDPSFQDYLKSIEQHMYDKDTFTVEEEKKTIEAHRLKLTKRASELLVKFVKVIISISLTHSQLQHFQQQQFEYSGTDQERESSRETIIVAIDCKSYLSCCRKIRESERK